MDDFPNIAIQHYPELRATIKSGDILLCSGNTGFSNLIKQATSSVWSHVAFILRLEAVDRLMVLESVESFGVRTVPLSHYVYNYNASGKGYEGRLMLARHLDLQPRNIGNLSKRAIDLLGYPYRTEEIVHIAERLSMGLVGVKNLSPDASTHNEFICSEYAYICFQSIGLTIDFNPLGFISPDDFARCPRIKPLSFIQTETMATKPMTDQKNIKSYATI